ncbi:MAG: hypothetical protein AAGD32_07130 [Planctomycetota bacterium]
MRRFAFVVTILVAVVAHAEPRRTGNIVYELPAGWETRDRDGLFHNVRPEDWLDRDTYPDLYIVSGEHIGPDPADLQRWALQRMDAVVKDDDEDDVLTWKQWQGVDDPAFAAKGFVNMMFGMGVVHRESGRFDRGMAGFAFTVDGHAGLIFIEFDEPDAATASVEAMLELVQSFRFINRCTTPLEGQSRPGPFNGIYWGTWLGHTLGLDGMLQMQLRHHTYVFFPDGRFCEDIPPGGVTGFDYDKLADSHTHFVGNYFVDGNAVILRYASGEIETLDYEDGIMKDGMAMLQPVNIPPDGWRFEGERSVSFYASMSAGIDPGSTTTVSGGATYVFKLDGTVTSDRWSGASGSFDSGVSFGSFRDNEPEIGTYDVNGGVLTITRPDGSTRAWDIFITEHTDRDTGKLERTLWIGGDPADGIKNVPAGVRPDLRSKPINPLSPPVNPLDPPR